MDSNLKSKIDLFIQNRQAVGDAFMFEYGLNCMVSSLILTNANRRSDIEKIKEARKILASKTSILSSFRVTVELAVLTKMSIQTDPEKYIDDVLAVYKTLRGKRIIEYNCMVLSAMTIVDLGLMNEAANIAKRMESIVDKLSKKHPLLSDESDIAFAVLLALSEKDDDALVDEIEECYVYLKKELKVKADANAIQGLSELLVISGGNLREKCDKSAELFTTFKEHGARYGSYYEFSSLGALAELDIDMDELVDMVIETEEYLGREKGFGNWTLQKRERLMFAAIFVADMLSGSDDQIYNKAVNSAVISSALASIVAEEVATMTCVSMAMNSAFD